MGTFGDILGGVAAIPGDIANGAERLGGAASRALSSGIPSYPVDPTTGATDTIASQPSKGNIWRNLLAGALTGLAATHRGQSGAEALGQGAMAAMNQRQAADQLARQHAQQQFTNQQAASRLQTEQAQAATQDQLAKAQMHRYDLQNAGDAQRLAQAAADDLANHRQMSAQLATTLEKSGHGLMGHVASDADAAQLWQQNPDLIKRFVNNGDVHLVPTYGEDGKPNGADVYGALQPVGTKRPIGSPFKLNLANGQSLTLAPDTPYDQVLSAVQGQVDESRKAALANLDNHRADETTSVTPVEALQALEAQGLAAKGKILADPKNADPKVMAAAVAANDATYSRMAQKYGGWGVLHAARAQQVPMAAPAPATPPLAPTHQPAAGADQLLPPGAIAGRQNGKLVGYMLGGQWHQLP